MQTWARNLASRRSVFPSTSSSLVKRRVRPRLIRSSTDGRDKSLAQRTDEHDGSFLRDPFHEQMTYDECGHAEAEDPRARAERTGDQNRLEECCHPQEL